MGSFYHLFSKSDFVIFRDEEDYFSFVNKLASIGVLTNSRVIAFCVLSTHVHLVIESDDVDCFCLFLRRGFTRWWNRKYFGSSSFLFLDNRVLDSKSNLIVAINYVLKNPLHHSICKDISLYKFSSFGCYFSGDVVGDNFKCFSDFSFRLRRRLFGSVVLPSSFLFNDSGVVFKSFVDFLFVESLYGSDRFFYYNMGRLLKEEIGVFDGDNVAMADSKLKLDCFRMSDIDVCNVIDGYVVNKFGYSSFLFLQSDDMDFITKVLSNMGISISQINRCIWRL